MPTFHVSDAMDSYMVCSKAKAGPHIRSVNSLSGQCVDPSGTRKIIVNELTADRLRTGAMIWSRLRQGCAPKTAINRNTAA